MNGSPPLFWRANTQLFARLIVRPLRSEPVRTLLTILAITLGVSVVVAIDLAGQSAAGSFHSSLESLAGRGDLLITGSGGVDEHLLGKLVALPYPLQFAPRIEDFASIDGKGAAVPFLGLDLIGQSRNLLDKGDTGSFLASAQENPIWVSSALGLRAGQHVSLLVNDRLRGFTVAAIIRPRQTELGESRIIVADIGLAQRVTGKGGRLDSIEIAIPAGTALDRWHDLIGRLLPPGVNVAPRGTRTEENRKMLAAFRWNLHVLSYIALVVGAFLIYNTMAISVVRRRNEIGVLRALGATRELILAGFLAEAAFFALTGSLIGLVLGRLLAIGAVGLIGNTVQALYVSSEPAPITMTFGSAATGLALGVGVSVLAAFAPALEAARVAPVAAMARGREDYRTTVESRSRALLAFILFLLAAIFAKLPPIDRQPIFAYLAVLFLVAGTAAVIPALIKLFTSRTQHLFEKIIGVEALLALRSTKASLGRMSVLTAALATAVAMTASVGIMVGSFRETVSVWMNNQLKADLYLRPAGSAAADQHPTMSADIADRIEELPGVAAVDRFRAYPIFYEGLPATLAGGESSKAGSGASTRFLPGEDQPRILAKLPTGDYAVVSEPFANKHHVEPGSFLHVNIGGAPRTFQVLGIYYDYSTERGYIILDRHTLLKYLPDRAESNLAVYLKSGTNEQTIRRDIDAIVGGRAVLVFSNRSLRRAAIATFDRTFRITYALEVVAIAVAVMGIAGALLAMIIDRRRELALLRFLGAARAQVRGIILCEAGLLGLLANVIGLVLGTCLSLILIFVINKQSFGWTIQFHWPVLMLLTVLSGVYLATVLAGLYPARIALRMNPIEVIHEE